MKKNRANEYPDYFARFYDLIYHKLRDGVDNQYFLDKIKQTKGKILEVGVGTGRFIFDAFLPDLNYLIKGFDHHTDFDEEYEPGKRIKRIVSTQPDLINQLINIEFQFEWDEDNGTRTEIWESPLRFFFRYELEHLIERTECNKYQIFGDYKGNELGKNTKEFVVVCRK